MTRPELTIDHETGRIRFYLCDDGKILIEAVNLDSDTFSMVLDLFEVGELKDFLKRTE